MTIEMQDSIKKETNRCLHDFTCLATAPRSKWFWPDF